MAGASTSTQSEPSMTLAPATQLLSLGAELFGEVQRIIGTDRVRTLRIKLGNRVIKEIPVAPLTAIATLGLVLVAVIVSTMSIEVEHEPATAAPDSEVPR
jgi:hypothetical protein